MTYQPIELGSGLYYFSAILRLPKDADPYIYENDTHAAIGVTSVAFASNGSLRVRMDNRYGRMKIVHGTVQGDETITGRYGIVGGPSGGSGGSFDIYFFDTRLGRRLDLTEQSDRDRIQNPYANVWFEAKRLLL